MEVKDKLTTLESLKVAYDANRESINTLSEELLAQMGDVAQQSDVDALNARVTNLELNAGGDSNAEVVDARVSNSGTTYGTLKERLDEEYNQLTKELEEDISQLSEEKVDKQDGYSMVSDSEKQAWNNKSDFSGSYNDLTDKPEIPEGADLTGYATEDYVKDYAQPKGNYLTEHQDLSGYALKEEIPTVPEKLPNPQVLTFTGAATGSYDGSKPLTVNIPSGGGTGGSGGSSGWVKIAEYVWDGNTEFQPLSLDFTTGKMTFEETPVSTVVFPVLNLDKLGKGSFVNNYSKIPDEFLTVHTTGTLTLDSDAYTFGGVKSITEGGKNANVDVSAFHFERSGSSPEFEGLNAKRCKVRMTIPGGNVWQSNGNFTFYPVLSNGESMVTAIGNVGNVTNGRALYEIIEQEFNIHSNILTNDYSVNMSTYKQRTNTSQNVNNYSLLGQSFAVVDEGVTISSICFNRGNGNYFPCNGTIVEVFEYVG